VSTLALLPYLYPYWQVHREQGAARTLFDVELYSATWKNYLSTPSRIHYSAWSHRWFTGAALFPGLLAAGLAGVALVRGIAWRDPRARMCLTMGVCGVLLSFGTNLPGYATLYEFLLPLQAVRAVSRFGYLGIMAVGFLAAFGIADLQKRLPSGRWPAAAAVILAVLALEPLVAPIHLVQPVPVSSIYESIEHESHAVVAEMPLASGPGWFGNARYMINSTRHWRPMVNGYSGFAPASFHEHVRALAAFPQPAAIAALEQIGVTHVFVQIDGYSAEQHAMIEASPRLTRVASNEWILVYRVAER
jgi:hypothetical protein